MLNRGVKADASTPAKGKWRFDRASGEWVAPPQPEVRDDEPPDLAVDVAAAPEKPTAPVVPVTAAMHNGPGVAFYSPPVFTVLSAPPASNSTVTAPPAPRKTEWHLRNVLHPDVLLPLVGAALVLLIFLAWAA